MIKYVSGKFYDYSISPKIRQILQHWGYELTEKYFVYQLNKLIYKNELLPVQQTRNLGKSKRWIF